jgi:hypothetical protein
MDLDPAFRTRLDPDSKSQNAVFHKEKIHMKPSVVSLIFYTKYFKPLKSYPSETVQ